MTTSLPVAIIGAGPVGLAAAAHVLARGMTPLVLEAGARVGTGVRRWGHVRMFSPWQYAIDGEARALLQAGGWLAPPLDAFPTGEEIATHYLEPLAATPELRPAIRLNARVESITRQQHDRMKSAGRDTAPFLVRYRDRGVERELLARAVIDASGTIESPNPAGASGIPALGERAAAAHVVYGMPNVLGEARVRYAGQRVLVVGSGHSAFNVLADLMTLRAQVPGTTIHWAVRRATLARVFGGGENDQLAERGRLGQRVAQWVREGALVVHTGVRIDRVLQGSQGIVVASGERELPAVDEIVVATGFRPDLALADELRLELDPATQSPRQLAPLIDPNVHSCGTVRPHGAEQLRHPEENFYIVGMKSYGRAPTFLLLTGYEQVRSVVAAIAGDWAAAREVHLVLPETGVCGVDTGDATAGGACCGVALGDAPVTAEAALPVPEPVAASASSCAGASGTASACGNESAKRRPPAPRVSASRCCGTAAA
jgi:thioredoxin reductase